MNKRDGTKWHLNGCVTDCDSHLAAETGTRRRDFFFQTEPTFKTGCYTHTHARIERIDSAAILCAMETTSLAVALVTAAAAAAVVVVVVASLFPVWETLVWRPD